MPVSLTPEKFVSFEDSEVYLLLLSIPKKNGFRPKTMRSWPAVVFLRFQTAFFFVPSISGLRFITRQTVNSSIACEGSQIVFWNSLELHKHYF